MREPPLKRLLALSTLLAVSAQLALTDAAFAKPNPPVIAVDNQRLTSRGAYGSTGHFGGPHSQYMGRTHSMGHGHFSPTHAPNSPLMFTFDAELGLLTPLSHTIQFSKDGSEIDYVKDGGQDVLFPFVRLQTHLRIDETHGVTLLYQPLEILTQELAPRDLRIDDAVFEEGTPVKYRYSFPFWRLAYTYYLSTVARGDSGFEAGLGLALQIRNASIEFTSLNGEQFRANRNVGPVPLLRAVARYSTASSIFFEGEVDGFYAPVKYLNGGDSDVEGAIIDLNLRSGVALRADLEAYLNVRYLGGGAEGTSSDDEGPGDGYSSNWLHFLTLSLGARFSAL